MAFKATKAWPRSSGTPVLVYNRNNLDFQAASTNFDRAFQECITKKIVSIINIQKIILFSPVTD